MIISIDPSYAKSIAIAWLDKNKVSYKSIELDVADKDLETRDLHRIALKVFNHIVSLNPEPNSIVSVEGQFFRFNPKMAMTLVEVRALIQGMILGRFPSVKVITVSPRTWQAKILNASKMKSEQIKQLSIKYASDLVKKKVTEDEADSICILKYTEKYGK